MRPTLELFTLMVRVPRGCTMFVHLLSLLAVTVFGAALALYLVYLAMREAVRIHMFELPDEPPPHPRGRGITRTGRAPVVECGGTA